MEMEGKKHALPPSLPSPPPSSIFSSIIIHVSSPHCAMYHISCRIAIIAARSKQYVLMAYCKKQPPYFKRPQSGALRYREQQVKTQQVTYELCSKIWCAAYLDSTFKAEVGTYCCLLQYRVSSGF